jgi:predicted nucleic-acid-binding protein
VVIVDTNILVRLVVNDNPEQVERAANLIRSNSIFISKTVLLESEWVLRKAFKLPRESVIRSLATIVGLSNATLEDRDQFNWALEAHRAGMDFADAMHLRSGPADARFASFDRKLVKSAIARRIDAFEP